MSLIEKIDAEILSIKKILVSGTFTEEVYGTLMGKVQMAERIKEIILSEQKEPCGFCKNSESIKYHGVTEKLIDGTTITISGDTEATRCPMCGRLLNQPSIDTE